MVSIARRRRASRVQANSFWEPIVSKATEQNDKLKRAIIISVALHIILIALLIWSSFDEHLDASAGGDDEVSGRGTLRGASVRCPEAPLTLA